MICDAREQVFERIKREAAALGAEEVVGIKTYTVELGPSQVEIFALGTAVRTLPGMGAKRQHCRLRRLFATRTPG
jgi:uncharacterized protein YbjQ (UPF0145 family)